jgi:hypothetical protein
MRTDGRLAATHIGLPVSGVQSGLALLLGIALSVVVAGPAARADVWTWTGLAGN